MTLVELYSKDGCHLCEVAKETLVKIRQSYPFDLREVNIREGDEYYERFKERIPVVYINNEFAFQYRVPERAFIAKLRGAS